MNLEENGYVLKRSQHIKLRTTTTISETPENVGTLTKPKLDNKFQNV